MPNLEALSLKWFHAFSGEASFTHFLSTFSNSSTTSVVCPKLLPLTLDEAVVNKEELLGFSYLRSGPGQEINCLVTLKNCFSLPNAVKQDYEGLCTSLKDVGSYNPTYIDSMKCIYGQHRGFKVGRS